MAKKSVLLSLVILTVAALGATASAQPSGEPNCYEYGYFPAPVCNCLPSTPAEPWVDKWIIFGSTYTPAWWEYTGGCNGEGQPCPWRYAGISGPHEMRVWLEKGWCVCEVHFYQCVIPPGTLALCENGQCPPPPPVGPKYEFNVWGFTARYYKCGEGCH